MAISVLFFVFLTILFSVDATFKVQLTRRAGGDVFSSDSKINCSLYSADQLHKKQCKCLSKSKHNEYKTIPGSLYEDAFGYTRCFYDNGASIGCFSWQHYFQSLTFPNFQTNSNATKPKVRLIFDQSKYTSFKIVDGDSIWKTDGVNLQIRRKNPKFVLGGIYFLKLKLIGKNGTADKTFCALMKTQNSEPIKVELKSWMETISSSDENQNHLYIYILLGAGGCLLLLLALLIYSARKNCIYRLESQKCKISQKANKTPLGTASLYCKEASLMVLQKRNKAEDKKMLTEKRRDNDTEDHATRQEPDSKVKTPVMNRVYILSPPDKLVSNPFSNLKNISARSEQKIDGKENEKFKNNSEDKCEVRDSNIMNTEDEELKHVYEVTDEDMQRNYENITSELSPESIYAPSFDAWNLSSSPISKEEKEQFVTDYEVIDVEMEKEPYTKLAPDPYLTPVESEYQNLGRNSSDARSINNSGSDDDLYDYSKLDVVPVNMYQ